MHDLVGAAVVEVDGTERGRCVAVDRQPGGRPARARLRCAGAGDVRRRVRRRRRHDRSAGRPVRMMRPNDGVRLMRVDVFTVFPDLVDGFCAESLLGKARSARPRSTCAATTCASTRPTCTARSTTRRSAVVPGCCCVPSRSSRRSRRPTRRARCSCSGPVAGGSIRQLAGELAAGEGFSLLCGRYEGVDHRVREHLVDDELSVGDVVLAGGEVAACLVDRGRDPAARRGDGQRREPGDRELRRGRPARGAALHASGRVPRLAGPRGAALRRPRPDRQVATGAGTPPHAARRGPT